MRVGRGKSSYDWTEKWAKIPDTDSARTGWAHHDMAVSASGDIIGFHQADPTMLVFDPQGNLKRAVEVDVANAHGMSLVDEGGTEYLWMTDNTTGKVVKATLEGETVMSIEPPDIPVYRDGKYSPTAIAVDEERNGGTGDIWVADGYGENYVHRYDSGGSYLGSINGEEGEAAAFNQPHGIWVDTRKDERELYIADRANGMVQVYDLEGNYLRAFGREPGKDWLHSPSSFATSGDLLFLAELRGCRVTVLDRDDNLVAVLGEQTGAFLLLDEWPNIPQETLEPGLFNSPHGIAADPDGNIYVADWLIGGRITKLAPAGG